MLTVGSLFTGIGGFDLGFERAGFEIKWRCEIEAFCRKVLTAKMSGPPIYGDVRGMSKSVVPSVDVLVGGFPCQDVSVAGQGKGLDGERSGLFFQFARLIGELRPKLVVIENVPGLLSNRSGRDFATVLVHLVRCGYGLSWRVLDSRYFNVAQRRERVFLVLCAGDARRRAEAVLFEPPRGAWGVEAGEETRQDIAATLRGRSARRGVSESGRGGEDDSNLVCYALRENERNTSQGPGNYVPVVAACLNPGHEAKHSYAGDGGTMNLIARPLKSGGNDRHDESHETYIVPTLDTSLGHHRGSYGVGEFLLPSSGERARALTASTMHKRHDEDTDDLNQTFTPTDYGVRRLTPLECERVQGFPDAWTCLCGVTPYSTAACRCPDTPRYKALGNAVTVPVAEWIARRILKAEGLT